MWVFIALAGQFIGGTAALFDKLIIKKLYPNPVGYTFWLGILGIFSFFLLPFGFHLLPPAEMTLAFLAGSAFVLGFLLYFHGLARGQASNVVILLGTFLPISTFIWSRIILGLSLGTYHLGAFILLISGSVILFLTEPDKFRWRIFVFVLGSAALVGFSNALAKYVYTASNFATGFVYIKIGGFIMALLFLLVPQFRRKIFKMPRDLVATRLGYLANRAYAGTGSILVQFAIALGIPPLVDALYNFQLVVVFVGGWLILKEKVYGWTLVGKIIAISIIGSGILWLGIGQYLKSTAPNLNRSITWGVTFSQKFATQMGLDWKQAYEAILDDLGVRRIRLIAYWDDIEPERGEFNFSDLDYQMQRARDYNAQVILAVGQKVPRWPECHFPEWVTELTEESRRQDFFLYLSAVIDRYKNHSALQYWQIENEPYLGFGECILAEENLLDQEITVAKAIDPVHKIIISDSGEVGRWYKAAKRGDIFATTMYRRVYNNIFGYIDYHLPPEFFQLKEKITRFLIKDRAKHFIVIELAAEPWLQRQLYETTPAEQFQHFDLAFFQDTIQYAIQAGFDENYLWGVEWWYWLKERHGYPEFWDFAKTIFK